MCHFPKRAIAVPNLIKCRNLDPAVKTNLIRLVQKFEMALKSVRWSGQFQIWLNGMTNPYSESVPWTGNFIYPLPTFFIAFFLPLSFLVLSLMANNHRCPPRTPPRPPIPALAAL
jgi:hypothetical protein